MNPTQAIKKAVRVVGGQTILAAAIGTKQQNVWNWIHRDGKCPSDMAWKVETATEGKVKCHELRPDCFPKQKRVSA